MTKQLKRKKLHSSLPKVYKPSKKFFLLCTYVVHMYKRKWNTDCRKILTLVKAYINWLELGILGRRWVSILCWCKRGVKWIGGTRLWFVIPEPSESDYFLLPKSSFLPLASPPGPQLFLLQLTDRSTLHTALPRAHSKTKNFLSEGKLN
jgi:hypothetical protein